MSEKMCDMLVRTRAALISRSSDQSSGVRSETDIPALFSDIITTCVTILAAVIMGYNTKI